jgi:transposase
VDAMYRCVCGLDVHKKIVVACVRLMLEGGKMQQQVRTFGTMTRDLLALADWMAAAGVTHVAMESTGVFWKPIYNILEGQFEVLLVNAQHIKKVPGRKTDVKDCEWIAQLLQCGLLRASFVPQRPLRDLRDLTRHRAKLTQDRSAVVNRIQKILEDANVKLGSVATDVMGVSGRAIIGAIVEGEADSNKLAELARRRLRAKIPELRMALQGQVSGHHRFMLKMLLGQIDFLDSAIGKVSARIEEVSDPLFREAVALLATIDGIQQRIAENVIAEIGTNMAQFPSQKHISSWAGVCPGNDESAGKRRSGKTPKANRWLRRSLGEASWAVSHTKDTYLGAQFHRIAARRGRKRAAVAVSHTILVVIYNMLRNRVPYADLGADHFERLDPRRLTRYYMRKLESLGHKVTLVSDPA